MNAKTPVGSGRGNTVSRSVSFRRPLFRRMQAEVRRLGMKRSTWLNQVLREHFERGARSVLGKEG